MTKQGETMRVSKVFSYFFGTVGVMLAGLVIAICVVGRSAVPQMVMSTGGAEECAQDFLNRICAGDYAGASGYLYGRPTLDSGAGQNSQMDDIIWKAFTQSLSYSLDGQSYATTSGAAQNVSLQSLNIPSVTSVLRERAGALLEQRVAAAEDMNQVYSDNLEYREDFIQSILRDAVTQAITQDGQTQEQKLTLNLVFDQGMWYVLPDTELLNAISGGVLG